MWRLISCGRDRVESFTRQMGDLLAQTTHSLFVQLLQPLLLPLLGLVLEGSKAARAPGATNPSTKYNTS